MLPIALGARLKRFPWINTLGVKPNLSDYQPRDLELIRRAAKIYYPTLALAGQLASVGKKIFPSLACHLFAGDKIKQTALLTLLGLPHPRTKVYYGKQRKAIAEEFGFPMVAKTPRQSARGLGVWLCRDQNDLRDYLEHHPVAYIQEYLAKEYEVRVVVIGDEPVCSYRRILAPGTFKGNLSQGARPDFDNVPLEAVELARKAAYLAGMDDVGGGCHDGGRRASPPGVQHEIRPCRTAPGGHGHPPRHRGTNPGWQSVALRVTHSPGAGKAPLRGAFHGLLVDMAVANRGDLACSRRPGGGGPGEVNLAFLRQGGLQGDLDLVFEFRKVKGLDHVKVGRNGFHVFLEGVVGGAQDHRQVVILVADVLQQVQPVVIHHLDVQDHQVGLFLFDQLQKMVPAVMGHHLVAVIA